VVVYTVLEGIIRNPNRGVRGFEFVAFWSLGYFWGSTDLSAHVDDQLIACTSRSELENFKTKTELAI